MRQEFEPNFRKLGFAGTATAGVLALVAAACSSGESQEANTNSATPVSSPTPEVTIAPTDEPTPFTTEVPTPELMPTKDEVFELYSRGLAETGLNASNYPDLNATDLDRIRGYMNNCNNDRQPFDPWGDGQVLEPGNSDYGSMVNGQCEKIADFTSVLYSESGNQNFLEANQKWGKIHKSIYDSLSQDYRYLNSTFWNSIKEHYYSLAPK